jgi:hypothetical protein
MLYRKRFRLGNPHIRKCFGGKTRRGRNENKPSKETGETRTAARGKSRGTSVAENNNLMFISKGESQGVTTNHATVSTEPEFPQGRGHRLTLEPE